MWENWQFEGNYELLHWGVCIQNCTKADFWKDLLSICILFILGKNILQANTKRFFFWVWEFCPFLLVKMKDSFCIKWCLFLNVSCFYKQDLSNLFTLPPYGALYRKIIFLFWIYSKEIEYSVIWSYSCNWKRERGKKDVESYLSGFFTLNVALRAFNLESAWKRGKKKKSFVNLMQLNSSDQKKKSQPSGSTIRKKNLPFSYLKLQTLNKLTLKCPTCHILLKSKKKKSTSQDANSIH